MTKCLLIVVSALSGCATTSSPATSAPPSSDKDGLSCEGRIKVDGIPAEYSWVATHYPGAKISMQALTKCGGSPTDELHFNTTDGRAVTAYFDISSFF
ncbi:MAG TPA: hypothetical protein VGP07_04950 [Polyangia bacterium]|jgi:hypothetical protein